jgi:hypothetical protein
MSGVRKSVSSHEPFCRLQPSQSTCRFFLSSLRCQLCRMGLRPPLAARRAYAMAVLPGRPHHSGSGNGIGSDGGSLRRASDPPRRHEGAPLHIALARPHSISEPVLGTEWQCSRAVFVVTCNHR